MDISVDPHPSLWLSAFTTEFPNPLGTLKSPAWLTDLLQLDADAPLHRSEEIRSRIRDLLRHGGYKPTGRGKPASEYLVRSADQGKLSSINPAVDACNVVSLHSGLPISVIDLDRSEPPLRVGLAESGTSYVFNPSGQEIRIDGLLCLHDSIGPCANAVKDAQRTKTTEASCRTLTLIWGTDDLKDHTNKATTWYMDILRKLGAHTDRQTPMERPKQI